jgi:hypothetical protein
MESFTGLYTQLFNLKTGLSPHQILNDQTLHGSAVAVDDTDATSLVHIMNLMPDDPVNGVLSRAAEFWPGSWRILRWSYKGTVNAFLISNPQPELASPSMKIAASKRAPVLIALPGEDDEWYDKIALHADLVSLLVDYCGDDDAPATVEEPLLKINTYDGRSAKGYQIMLSESLPSKIAESARQLLYCVQGKRAMASSQQ